MNDDDGRPEMVSVMTSPIEIVRGETESGRPRLQAFRDSVVFAGAVDVGDKWVIFGYGRGVPDGELSVRSESDAREWLGWIAARVGRA